MPTSQDEIGASSFDAPASLGSLQHAAARARPRERGPTGRTCKRDPTTATVAASSIATRATADPVAAPSIAAGATAAPAAGAVAAGTLATAEDPRDANRVDQHDRQRHGRGL